MRSVAFMAIPAWSRRVVSGRTRADEALTMIRGESGIWDRWKLIEELLVRKVEFGGPELGPFAQRPVQPLRPSPTLNAAVIAATEHIREPPSHGTRRAV